VGELLLEQPLVAVPIPHVFAAVHAIRIFAVSGCPASRHGSRATKRPGRRARRAIAARAAAAASSMDVRLSRESLGEVVERGPRAALPDESGLPRWQNTIVTVAERVQPAAGPAPRLISIILPVHNQADHLRSVVEEFVPALSRLSAPHEILLVVNGSRDASIEIARELERTRPPVRAVESATGGWGHAVRLGLAEARGDLVCYTNCARTTADDLLLVLLYAMAYPGVVIKVNRHVRERLYRRVGSLLFNLECRALFELSCWDINGTPKAFPRAFDKLFTLTRPDDLLDLEFNIVCRTEGYPMLEVPILSTRRRGGRSTTTWASAARLYWGAYQLWRARRKALE
jgi:hypothetical protein